MSLSSIDLEKASKEIEEATLYEIPKVNKLREKAHSLKIQELNYRQCYAVAPVATDGGENRISFEPMNIEIIRVVDSEGKEYVQKIIPLSLEPEIFEKMFKEIPVLMNFCNRLGVDYSDISYFLPTKGHRKDDDHIDNRGVVRTFRDILEWAVLLDIAWNPGRSKVLLIRDGLLRTKSMEISIVKKMGECFKDAYDETGTMLVGVAKKSKVLNYLSLALTLEGTFDRDYPCFCEVPEEIEKESYNWAKKWLEGPVFGKLHLAKLSDRRDCLVLPVDIPNWLMPQRKEVLEYLAENAKTSFPIIGYPHPLIKAHENAVLHGLEMEILSDYLVKSILKLHTEKEIDKILAHVTLGHGISKGG